MLRETAPAGNEPVTYKSQVQRPTAEPPRNTREIHSTKLTTNNTVNNVQIFLLTSLLRISGQQRTVTQVRSSSLAPGRNARWPRRMLPPW